MFMSLEERSIEHVFFDETVVCRVGYTSSVVWGPTSLSLGLLTPP